MPDDVPDPYAIAIEPALRPEGQFVWAIRKKGKLLERSDRTYPTESGAREKALEVIQRDMGSGTGPRRR